MTEGFAARVLDAALTLCAQEGQATADTVAAYCPNAPTTEIVSHLTAWAKAGQLHARAGGVFVRAVTGSAWAQQIHFPGQTYRTDLGLPAPADLMLRRAG